MAGVSDGQDSPLSCVRSAVKVLQNGRRQVEAITSLSRDRRPQGKEQNVLELTEDDSFCLLPVVPICPEI